MTEASGWRDEYETTTSHGEIYPTPGEWWLEDAAASGVRWLYDIPRTEEGEPDYAVTTWDCKRATLMGDFEEPIETLTFRIGEIVVFTVDIEERGEGRHSPWRNIDPVWEAVAEALRLFHHDLDYTAVDGPTFVASSNTEQG